MPTQSKPITLLLAIIAALLAANLFVSLPPQEAQAQSPPPFDPPQEPTEPTVIGIAATQGHSNSNSRTIYRVWSDGTTEENRHCFFSGSPIGGWDWCGWEPVPE